MGVKRKIKRNKNLSVLKKTIGVLGRDNDGNFIYQHLKSRSFLDKTHSSIIAEIKGKYKFPMREKTPMEMTEIEKEILNLRKEEDRKSKLFLCYKTESPEYKKVENEITKLEIIANLVSFFDMEATVLDEDDNEVDYWNIYNVPKNNYLALCEYLISEDGMCLNEASINILHSEIQRMVANEKTMGEKFLDAEDKENEQKEIIEKLEGDNNDVEPDTTE